MAVAPEPNIDRKATGDGPDELEAAVLDYVRQNPWLSTRKVASGVHRSLDVVTAALRRLDVTEQVARSRVGRAVTWTTASAGA